MSNRSDAQIHKDVMDEIAFEPSVDSSRIVVAVTDGIVTLSGSVPNFFEKWRSESAVKRVSGVQGVAEELTVSLFPGMEQTETEIASAAANALEWDSVIPQESVRVNVEKGWITLSGQLEWQYQSQRAFEAVAHLRGVKGVTLDRVTRVYPFLSESELVPFQGGAKSKAGNLEANDQTAFLLELTLPPRPPARVRIAQIGLTFDVPGEGRRGEIPPVDVVVEFTFDEGATASVNPTVMGYVQQRNLEGLVKQAAAQAQSNPQAAAKTIELARAMTVKLGNAAMTQVLDKASAELASGQGISAGTAKTIKMGAKTQTIKVRGPQNDPSSGSSGLPSDEEIRKLTGA